MRIEFQCNDGSQLKVIPEDIYGRGVGGAELALLSLTEQLARMGHEVHVYNDPREPGIHNGVMFHPKAAWKQNSNTDVFVLFRSPNDNVRHSKAPLKIFWSCDQYTIGDFRTQVFPFVDATVCISPYHRNYFVDRYSQSPDRIVYIDLGVRVEDYEEVEVERDPYQVIFCSIPDRGLHRLRAIWPELKAAVPELSIAITGDYRLWGSSHDGVSAHKRNWERVEDVFYYGAIPRKQLVELQLSSGIHLYPCIYEELFCISAAETQVAGAVPITSSRGALESTNFMGYQLDGNPDEAGWLQDYKDFVRGLLSEDYEVAIEDIRDEMMEKARERFSWATIAERWVELFEAGVK